MGRPAARPIRPSGWYRGLDVTSRPLTYRSISSAVTRLGLTAGVGSAFSVVHTTESLHRDETSFRVLVADHEPDCGRAALLQRCQESAPEHSSSPDHKPQQSRHGCPLHVRLRPDRHVPNRHTSSGYTFQISFVESFCKPVLGTPKRRIDRHLATKTHGVPDHFVGFPTVRSQYEMNALRTITFAPCLTCRPG